MSVFVMFYVYTFNFTTNYHVTNQLKFAIPVLFTGIFFSY